MGLSSLIFFGVFNNFQINFNSLPDDNLYWYSKNSDAKAKKLFCNKPSIVDAIKTNT